MNKTVWIMSFIFIVLIIIGVFLIPTFNNSSKNVDLSIGRSALSNILDSGDKVKCVVLYDEMTKTFLFSGEEMIIREFTNNSLSKNDNIAFFNKNSKTIDTYSNILMQKDSPGLPAGGLIATSLNKGCDWIKESIQPPYPSFPTSIFGLADRYFLINGNIRDFPPEDTKSLGEYLNLQVPSESQFDIICTKLTNSEIGISKPTMNVCDTDAIKLS